MKNNSQYSFEAIFDIDETRALFKEFLIGEKNVEPLLFIEQAEQYSLKKSDFARLEFADKIIKEFIIKGCKYEINVSGEMKDLTLKTYELSDESDCPATLFREVHKQILLELKIDCFPRFVKSQPFEQFVEQKKAKDDLFLTKIQKKRKSKPADSSIDSLGSAYSNPISPSGSSNSINISLDLKANGSPASVQQTTTAVNGNANLVTEVTHIDSDDESSSDSVSITPQQAAQYFTADLPNSENLPAELSSFSTNKPSSSPESTELSEESIVQSMSKPYTGITLKDRKSGFFKTYSKCFTGSEMLNWTQSNQKMNRGEAVKCCTEILISGQVEPLNNRKKPNVLKQVIDSDSQFYKFATKKTVAIVGAGFGGVYLYQLIRKQFDVTLFDEKPYFEYKGDYHLLVVDPSQINHITKPYKDFIRQAKIVHGKVRTVTPQGVFVDNEKHVDGTLLPFDYVVVCTGTSAWVPFPIDEVSQACCLYPYQSKTILDKFSKLIDAKTICVIGGGSVGIEVVGELCSTYKDTQIVLISQRSIFLERMCPAAHKIVTKTLGKFPNLKIYTSRKVIEIKNNTLYFKLVTDRDEDTQNEHVAIEEIKAEAFVVCAGTSPRTQILQKHFPRSLNKRGFVRVNNKLQIENGDKKGQYHRNVFAIGDVCDMEEEKLAHTARLHAQTLAKNLKLIDRSESETKMAIYKPEPRLQLISLGRSTALMIVGEKVIADGNLSVKLKNLTRTKVMFEIKG